MKRETWLKVKFNGDDDFIDCGLDDVEFRVNNMDTLDKAIEVIKERLLELKECCKGYKHKVEFVDDCIELLKDKFDIVFNYADVNCGNWDFDILFTGYIETNFEKRNIGLSKRERLEKFPELTEEYKERWGSL